MPLENIVGKGENAGNQHVLLFSQCFFISSKREIILSATFILSFASALNLFDWKIMLSGNKLEYNSIFNPFPYDIF